MALDADAPSTSTAASSPTEWEQWPAVAEEMASARTEPRPPRDPVEIGREQGEETALALQHGRFAVVTTNLIHACANDLLARGSLARSATVVVRHRDLVARDVEALLLGAVRACRAEGVALTSLQLAPLAPDAPLPLAATATMTGERVSCPQPARAGDVLVGLLANGLHSRGHAQAVSMLATLGPLDTTPASPDGETLLAALLARHKSYGSSLHRLLLDGVPRAVAHVDTGGLRAALLRLLSPDTDAVVDPAAWTLPPLLAALAGLAKAPSERGSAFGPPSWGGLDWSVCNAGVGLLLAVPPARVEPLLTWIRAWNEPVHVIGRVEPGAGRARW